MNITGKLLKYRFPEGVNEWTELFNYENADAEITLPPLDPKKLKVGDEVLLKTRILNIYPIAGEFGINIYPKLSDILYKLEDTKAECKTLPMNCPNCYTGHVELFHSCSSCGYPDKNRTKTKAELPEPINYLKVNNNTANLVSQVAVKVDAIIKYLHSKEER